ncbi:class I SAM-dependent methyltransferase [Patescibacteria group bacterium]|nr:class I SAM-dependent methyltransferase [Patescibacteria group bacterium]MBU2220643.1 class I SAM-dependent methyltransferase [Patescibacteria group bacterium]
MKFPTKTARSVFKKLIAVIPKKLQKKLFGHYWAMHSPDRLVLVKEILPKFSKAGGTMLWVGCEKYTRTYPKLLEKHGGVCWTLELVPEQSRWGNSGRHIIGDLTKADLLFPEHTFDVVFCNGVIGWGVNGPEQQRDAFRAMAHIMKPGATLLLGWNTYRSKDPVLAGLSSGWFVPGTLDGLEQKFKIGEHVYEIFERKD